MNYNLLYCSEQLLCTVKRGRGRKKGRNGKGM